MEMKTISYRTEQDSIGEMKVPKDAYYGVQTLRAWQNFQMTGNRMHPAFIRNLAMIKKAAAITNHGSGRLSSERMLAIVRACDEVMAGAFADAFIVDPIQGGAGTSMNMNLNEVIANRAGEILGDARGSYQKVHPNDHVNMSQSTNDVIPTAGKLTALDLLAKLNQSLASLANALQKKSLEFDDVLKMGRTQLEDAVPMRLGQEFHSYATMILRVQKRLKTAAEEMHVVNLGGTAIGTAINVDPYYFMHIVPELQELSGYSLKQAEDLFDGTEHLDSFSAVSGALKAGAMSISKMCNDLRLLSSGPRTGFGEITLPAKQNGSSIMPGKVNPVIPEVVNQTAFQIAGLDVTISMAVEAGQMELNAFEPVIFYDLFQELDMLKNAVDTLTVNCIEGITANRERCEQLMDSSVGIATALCPYLGYQQSAEIAKTALKTGKTVRSLVLSRHLMNDHELREVLNPDRMTLPPETRERARA